jgi:hypothetical protein
MEISSAQVQQYIAYRKRQMEYSRSRRDIWDKAYRERKKQEIKQRNKAYYEAHKKPKTEKAPAPKLMCVHQDGSEVRST